MHDDKIELVEVESGDGPVLLSCRIRRSPRARRMNLRVKNVGEIVLTLPLRSKESDGIDFVRANSKWLERKLSEPRTNPSLEQYFSKGGKVSLDNETRTVVMSLNARPRRRSWSTKTEGELHLSLDPLAPIENQLLSLLRSLAKDWLPPRVHDLAEFAGEEVQKIRVGDQKSRWGSCSSKGTISLNWRLLLLRIDLQDYVIFHELAHLRHMNHSPAFWAHLETLQSNARIRDREINKAGKILMTLGRELS
ncbi:MAG: SprT family zinc-dependent metalloprotease [Verrucomicrobia bacterium]|nr:SprT family zinc-dependent metalloprotease [Verrucomicrobiota bacterium]MDA1048457.1 SprT family zinc-dependent metalloprotease [Verrucomicrobiota bacterium]